MVAPAPENALARRRRDTAAGSPATYVAPAEGRRLSTRGYRWLLAGLAAGVLASLAVGVMVGSVGVSPRSTLAIVGHHLWGGSTGSFSRVEDQIVWQFRLPRALLAAVVGAGLAAVGTVLQALVRNPLADPHLLGVSSGAALGAVVVVAWGSSAVGGLSLSGAAFVGALVALGLVYAVAQERGFVSPGRLLLAGVALASLFQAAYSFVLQKGGDAFGSAARTVLYWLLGSLSGARWGNIALPCAVVVVGIALLATQTRVLNALLSGDETAASLGVHLGRTRLGLFVLTSLLVGAMVAAAGAIAFVGLMVPHATRLVVGADHRRVLPVAVLAGAIFLQLADLVARLADQPQEVPLSIVTAVVGVPWFVWLLRSRARGGARLGV